jgi:hypothetical protein
MLDNESRRDLVSEPYIQWPNYVGKKGGVVPLGEKTTNRKKRRSARQDATG